MEQWEQVVVEWINCLDILRDPLKNIEELQNGIFYINILNLVRPKHKYGCNQEDIIIKFIEDKYPSFRINNTEHIYIASLLLMYASRATMFHTPMCNKLKHKTQVRIKTFLENILPLRNDVTRGTMKEVIAELVENTSITPNCRHTPPLEDSVKSPIMRSAHSSYKIRTERTRELRKLRCNLDMERFKNDELQDDINIYKEKIQNLEAKLEASTAQLKALREEQIKPRTPQLSRKKENVSLCEDYYEEYIDLEIQLNEQLDEMNNLEMEKDSLSKTLASTQRQSVQYKESLVICEQSLECLSRKMEVKDGELIELRMNNEELRARLKEYNNNFVTEQSFEVEDSVVLLSPTVTLNNSETLSSVIEIQLQEARKESAILQTEVDSLKRKLDILNEEYRKEQYQQLQKQVELSKTTKQEFESQLKEIHASYEQKLEDMKEKMKKIYNEQVAILHNQEEMVRKKLQGQMESMCQKQREEISKYEAHVEELSSQLCSIREKLLIEQQQKAEAIQRLKEEQIKKLKEVEKGQQISCRTPKTEKQEMISENAQQTTHKVTAMTQETFERRHSVRNLQAMGNAFRAEDEEEVFDNVYLADLKRGFCPPSTDVNRLSILQMRNAQCKPHLKSSYPVEMQFLSSSLTEEEIKLSAFSRTKTHLSHSSCVTEDNFNDSLNQSLLPEQETKKKDRFQGNEFRSPSSRILKERNTDRRTTTTPHSPLRHLFTKRQDENASTTPKGRRLNIFRKSRMQ